MRRSEWGLPRRYAMAASHTPKDALHRKPCLHHASFALLPSAKVLIMEIAAWLDTFPGI
jgi:hypothetical protein